MPRFVMQQKLPFMKEQIQLGVQKGIPVRCVRGLVPKALSVQVAFLVSYALELNLCLDAMLQVFLGRVIVTPHRII